MTQTNPIFILLQQAKSAQSMKWDLRLSQDMLVRIQAK